MNPKDFLKMLREEVDTEKWNRRIERRKNNPVGMERVLRAIAGRMGQHRAEYLNAADAADKVPGAAPGWETLKHRNKGRENRYKSVVKDMHAMADVWDKAVTTAANSKLFPKITKAVSDTAPGNEPGTTVRPEHVKGKRDRKGKRSVGPYSVAYTRHRNPIRDDQRSHMADSYDFSDRVFEALKNKEGDVYIGGKKGKAIAYDPEMGGNYSAEGAKKFGDTPVSSRKAKVNWKGIRTGEGEKHKI